MDQNDDKEHCSPPGVNTIKVNVDAFLYENSRCYSFSVVAQNHRGEQIEVRSRYNYGSLSLEIAEAISIMEALGWIKNKGWPNVEIKSDCLLEIQAIQSSTGLLSYVDRVIEECKQSLKSLKDCLVSLRFVKRSANKLTQYLARYNCSIADLTWSVDNAQS